MNIWLIKTKNKEELKRKTNVVYESRYTNLHGVESELNREELLLIDGVLTVEEAATGTFNKKETWE